jgi:hypothetical protein
MVELRTDWKKEVGEKEMSVIMKEVGKIDREVEINFNRYRSGRGQRGVAFVRDGDGFLVFDCKKVLIELKKWKGKEMSSREKIAEISSRVIPMKDIRNFSLKSVKQIERLPDYFDDSIFETLN